ncbi:hypothetical protein GCM10022262_36130 [Georgenia daeguensis]|uniref:Uncharacterized protein n=1 Tax=Georgenia daeguensis TaxID=908355 RepID=A0ABP6UKL2_9MICO
MLANATPGTPIAAARPTATSDLLTAVLIVITFVVPRVLPAGSSVPRERVAPGAGSVKIV